MISFRQKRNITNEMEYSIHLGKLYRPHCPPSLKIMVSKGNHLQLAELFRPVVLCLRGYGRRLGRWVAELFRLVNYFNLPRYMATLMGLTMKNGTLTYVNQVNCSNKKHVGMKKCTISRTTMLEFLRTKSLLHTSMSVVHIIL